MNVLCRNAHSDILADVHLLFFYLNIILKAKEENKKKENFSIDVEVHCQEEHSFYNR